MQQFQQKIISFFKESKSFFSTEKNKKVFAVAIVGVLVLGTIVTVYTLQTQSFDTRSSAAQKQKKQRNDSNKKEKKNKNNQAIKVNKLNTRDAILWIQDSNGGKAGTTLPDFKQQFDQPELWQQARQYIDVYQFHTSIFTSPEINVDDTFLKDKIIPVLQESNIAISLNVTGANWSKCDNRQQVKFNEAEIIDRIASAGGRVSYLTMQSTISKTVGGNAEALNRCGNYPIKARIDDMVEYMQFMKNKYPWMQFGMTDADATKGSDYISSLQEMREGLRNYNLKLDYIFLDNSAKYLEGNTTDELKAVERFIERDLNTQFGLVYTANKLKVNSNSGYFSSVIRDFTAYDKGGGNPKHYMVTSWFAYPERFLPEDNDSFTLMRTVRVIGERLKK